MISQKFVIGIIFQLLFLLVIQSVQTAEPFYIIAHMVNNRAALDWALQQGANAIENDFQFNSSGFPSVIEHGNLCDCVCAVLPDHVCHNGLNSKCEGSGASRDAAEHVQDIASRSGIALYYVDSKVEPEWGDRLRIAGTNVISFLDNNLFNHGYQGKVLISSTNIDTYDYIQAAVLAASNSVNKERYFFTFDEEIGNYRDVIAMLSRLTNKRIYSTGSSACSPIIYEDALKTSVAGKSRGENGMTIVWTIDLESNMKKMINLGVQGLMTNRVGEAKQIVNSMGLNLANTAASIPVSTVNISSLYKCSCSYHNGGCMISYPAPQGKACKCTKILWSCVGIVVSCDTSNSKCDNPDESKAACQLGNGNCNGY